MKPGEYAETDAEFTTRMHNIMFGDFVEDTETPEEGRARLEAFRQKKIRENQRHDAQEYDLGDIE